ncbi:MAG: tetratricopeptide repeat protein, partial [Microcystaceae cyanobacterium]
AFSHILLELWLTQGQTAWLHQEQTYLLNLSQLLARPKPTLRKIAAFLEITPTETTLKDLLLQCPLPTPDLTEISKGFSSLLPAYPSPDTLAPEQRLLLTLFLRPSREIWFGPDTERYDRQLNQWFPTVATEAWQKTFQVITDLVNEHLGDRLGDWLQTAYDHGVVPLQVQNPIGAAQLLSLLAGQLQKNDNQQEAKILYREALRLNSQDINTGFILGQLAERESELSEAITYYQLVLQQAPQHQQALFRLADLCRLQGNFTQAEDYLRQILQKEPQHQIAQYWLLKTLDSQGQLERAKQWVKEEDIEFVLKLPDYLSHTGGTAYDEANYELAKNCYQLALELEPNRYQDWFDLALVANKEKKRSEAIRCYQKVLTLNPDHGETMVNLGALFIHQGQFTQAIALLEKALTLNPQNAMAYHNLAIAYVYQGRLAEAAFYANQAVQNCPEDAGYHSHLLTILSAMAEIRSEDLAQVSRVWYDNHVVAKGLAPITHWTNTLDRERPLRVGFISGDFKRHSVSYFMKPIFEHHHPEQIQIYAYAQVDEPDDLTETLKSLCDHWRDTVGLEDQALADLIQQDQIDILVDLSGHTLHHRLSVLGMKPAPIQATYLGYPATTGLPTVDYWITDYQIHPEDTTEVAVEEIWRLPR